MRIAPKLASAAPTAALMLAMAAIAVGGLRLISSSAFTTLEGHQAAQDAQRLQIALDGDVSLLKNYGATNSIWDGSQSDLRTRNQASFTADLPPGDLHDLYDLSGVLGLSTDGKLVTGGLATGSDSFSAVPIELKDSALMRRTFSLKKAAGDPVCGVISTSSGPYLFCGFGSYNTAGTGRPAGGLVFLKSLSASGLAKLGKQVGLSVQRAEKLHSGTLQPQLNSSIGAIPVATVMRNAHSLSVSASLPTINGSPVVLQVNQDRPIAAAARKVQLQELLLLGLLAAVLISALLWMLRREVTRQVHPLRTATEEVIAAQDPSQRVGHHGDSEIGQLAEAIDGMLAALEQVATQRNEEHTARELEVAEAGRRQREAEQAARESANEAVSRTSASLVDEMAQVLDHASSVQSAADEIEARVLAVEEASQRFVAHSSSADASVDQLVDCLGDVRSLTTLIRSIADQTSLLALNATIEAAHAGDAGRGFAVVADEVKSLAQEAGASAARIGETLALVQSHADAVVGAVSGLTDGLGTLNEATGAARGVLNQQRDAVQVLSDQAAASRDRADALGRDL